MMSIFKKYLIQFIKNELNIDITCQDMVDLTSEKANKFSRHLIVHFPKFDDNNDKQVYDSAVFENSRQCGIFVRNLCDNIRKDAEMGQWYFSKKQEKQNISNSNSNDNNNSTTIDDLRKLFVWQYDWEKERENEKENETGFERIKEWDKKIFIDEAVYTRNRVMRLLYSAKLKSINSDNPTYLAFVAQQERTILSHVTYKPTIAQRYKDFLDTLICNVKIKLAPENNNTNTNASTNNMTKYNEKHKEQEKQKEKRNENGNKMKNSGNNDNDEKMEQFSHIITFPGKCYTYNNYGNYSNYGNYITGGSGSFGSFGTFGNVNSNVNSPYPELDKWMQEFVSQWGPNTAPWIKGQFDRFSAKDIYSESELYLLNDEILNGKINKWKINKNEKIDEIASIIYYVVNNRFCMNIGRCHRSNGIYFLIKRKDNNNTINTNKNDNNSNESNKADFILEQRCFDVDCRGFKSPPIDIPNYLINLLNNNSGNSNNSENINNNNNMNSMNTTQTDNSQSDSESDMIFFNSQPNDSYEKLENRISQTLSISDETENDSNKQLAMKSGLKRTFNDYWTNDTIKYTDIFGTASNEKEMKNDNSVINNNWNVNSNENESETELEAFDDAPPKKQRRIENKRRTNSNANVITKDEIVKIDVSNNSGKSVDNIDGIDDEFWNDDTIFKLDQIVCQYNKSNHNQ